MADYTRAQAYTLVNGVDVTETIAPDDYFIKQQSQGHQIYTDIAAERRRKLYRDARAQADRKGATAHIMPSGACEVRFWDDRSNAVATIQATEQHTSNPDFDVILWGWKDGAARIVDHRI